MAKRKSKKQKRPNIPIQTMARPRLEKILERRLQNEIDEEQYVAAIKALMAEIDREAVLNALIGQLDNATPEQRDALMGAIPKLEEPKAIKHLWNLVRRSKMSAGGKMTALLILKQMGEEVNLDDPSEYLSWRDLKQSDLSEITDMARFGLRALAKELQRLETADDVERLMLRFEEMGPEIDRQEVLLMQVESLVEMGDAGAADMLAAMAATTPYPTVRAEARAGLSKLADQNVTPQSEGVKALLNERFYAAYSTDPSHPWQRGVILLFERGRNLVQAMAFLLDFGHPWRGAMKDMFVTYSMPPEQFQREMLDQALSTEGQYLQVPYERARQFILDAVEANRKYNVRLPSEFQEFRPLIERRILAPSPETLAYAEQVDAQSVDEWEQLGRESAPLLGPEDLTEEGEEAFFEFDFDELLSEVNDYYEQLDEDLEEGERFVLPQEWLVDYLVTRYEEDGDTEDLINRWDNLTDFMAYLDEYDDSPESLADIQGYHLSEFIIDYWEEYVVPWGDMESAEEREEVIDTINDLYAYLATQKHIPMASAERVAEAVKTIFSRENELISIPR